MRLFVAVDGDREVFETIDDFAETVTPEALHSFNEIQVQVGDPASLQVTLYFEREGHVLTTGRVGLIVESGDPRVAETVEQLIAPALDRGSSWFDWAWRSPAFPLAVLALGLFVLAQFDLLSDSWPAFVFAFVLAIVLYGAVLQLVPAVEVAAPGQSRLERTGRLIAGIGIGLVGAALGKWLLG